MWRFLARLPQTQRQPAGGATRPAEDTAGRVCMRNGDSAVDSTAISLVRTTFKAVAAIDDGPARLTQSFYSVLFANNPDVREFFPAAMEAQRERLVHAIAYVIDQLDDPE